MSATLFAVHKEMSLARLDWTRRRVPTRSLRLVHIGVFATTVATTDRDHCHHCRADQKTIHLGPRVFDQRYPFLSASRLACPTPRMAACFTERGQYWAGRICTRHIRSRDHDYERSSRRKTLPDRSFTRRHTCGDIRSLFAPEHQGPRTFRRATLLRAFCESISRRSGNPGSTRDFRYGSISRFTLITRKRAGISWYLHLVTLDGCGDEYF